MVAQVVVPQPVAPVIPILVVPVWLVRQDKVMMAEMELQMELSLLVRQEQVAVEVLVVSEQMELPVVTVA
jgi:hypothetical protein